MYSSDIQPHVIPLFYVLDEKLDKYLLKCIEINYSVYLRNDMCTMVFCKKKIKFVFVPIVYIFVMARY